MRIINTLVIFLLMLATGCCCRRPKSKAQVEKDRVAAAAASAKRASEKAELAETKRRCGDAFGSKDWEDICRSLVSAKLFQPSSADFSYLMSVVRYNDKAKCTQTYSSTVESKNVFGATIEHKFICSFNSKTDRVTLESIRMN